MSHRKQKETKQQTGIPGPVGLLLSFCQFPVRHTLHPLCKLTPDPTSTLYILLAFPLNHHCTKMKQGPIFSPPDFIPLTTPYLIRVFLSIELALKLSIVARRPFPDPMTLLLNQILTRIYAAASIEEHKRQKLIPFPRVGKRQALIPFPRTGKRSGSGAPGPPAGVGTVADFLRRLEREREAADAQPMSEGGAATEARITMKGQSSESSETKASVSSSSYARA